MVFVFYVDSDGGVEDGILGYTTGAGETTMTMITTLFVINIYWMLTMCIGQAG